MSGSQQTGAGKGVRKKSLAPLRHPVSSLARFQSTSQVRAGSQMSRRSTVTAPSEQERKQQLDNHSKDNMQNVKFVYSEAVERAFRHTFLCSAFGPKSGKPRDGIVDVIEISHLPELYRDFQFIKRNLESNHRYIEKLRKELPEVCSEEDIKTSHVKLPKLSLRNALALAKWKTHRSNHLKPEVPEALPDHSNNVQKLPPIGPKTSIVDGAGRLARTSRSPSVAMAFSGQASKLQYEQSSKNFNI